MIQSILSPWQRGSLYLTPLFVTCLAVGIGLNTEVCLAQELTLYKTLEPHGKKIDSIAISPNGQFLATSSLGDKSFKVIDLGKEKTLIDESVRAWCSCFSIDNAKLAVAIGSDGKYSIRVYDTKSWQVERTIDQAAKDAMTTMSYSPDGKLLAVGCWDKRVKVFDAKGDEKLNLVGSTGPVKCLAFGNQGRDIVAGGVRSVRKPGEPDGFLGEVVFWSLDAIERSSLAKQGMRVDLPASTNSVSFDPKGSKLLCGHSLGWWVMDIPRQRVEKTYDYDGDKNALLSSVYTGDGRHIALLELEAGPNGTTQVFRLLDATSYKEVASKKRYKTTMRFALSNDGSVVASPGYYGYDVDIHHFKSN
jgi:WD40 repeat protein